MPEVARIGGRITVLDGGMGQELLARAPEPPTSLWSAEVMDRHPELVVEVHLDYIEAGAQVITVNAYSASRCRLEAHGRGADVARLQRLAVELANEARSQAGADGRVRIAGCLSPYLWTYRPELAPSFETLVPHYAEAVELQRAGVDLFLCETMGSGPEGAAAAVAATDAGLPVWLSWNLHDDGSGLLRTGETIDAATRIAEEAGARLDAILVNCCPPESIEAGLTSLLGLGARLGVPVGAYANAFGPIADDYSTDSTVAQLEGRPDLDPARHAERCTAWIDAGLAIVGGCCEIGPAHIRALSDSVRPPWPG